MLSAARCDTLVEPIEDPQYAYSLPGAGSATVDRPPDAAFPSCVTPTDVSAGKVTCNGTGWASVPSNLTLYPGKYALMDIPSGKNVTLSRDCFPGDTTCVPGVYWFSVPAATCTGSNKGGLWMKGTSTSSTLTGQGVLLVFDPLEGGPGCMSFEVSGNNQWLHLNDSVDMRSSKNPTGTIPFAWYNPSDTDPLADPVTIWVRPNSSYLMTGNASGSNVIKFSSNPNVFENGLIYGAQDNAQISGNGAANGSAGLSPGPSPTVVLGHR